MAERTPEHSSTKSIPGGLLKPSNQRSSQIKLNLRQKDSNERGQQKNGSKEDANPKNGDVQGVRRRLKTSCEGIVRQSLEQKAVEKTVDSTVAKDKDRRSSKTPSPNSGNGRKRRSPSKGDRRKRTSSNRSTPVKSGRQTPRSNVSSRTVTPGKGTFNLEGEDGISCLRYLTDSLSLLNDGSGNLNTQMYGPSDQRTMKGRESNANSNSVSNATEPCPGLSASDVNSFNKTDDMDVTLRADDVTTDDDDEWEDVSEPGEQGLKTTEAIPDLDPEVDGRLDKMAVKHKMTATNVKSMIHHILTDSDVVSLMESKMNKLDEALNTAESAGREYQPKLTRAKLKEITEGKTSQPWPLAPWPLSPVKPEVKKKVTLMDLQFSEVEDDEYDPRKGPEQEMSEDDSESIVSSSRMSDLGSPMPSSPCTPCTPTTPCTPVTPMLMAGTVTTPSIVDQAVAGSPMGPPRQPKQKSLFRKRLIIEEAPETIARRTRSKLPLVDTPLELIESSFVAPDFTPEMYDLEYDLDDDYFNFIKTLVRSDENQIGSEPVDDENDPEYNFMAEEEVDDRDEMRHDKSVKVTKKELNELLDGVLDIFGPDADEDLPPVTDYAEPCASSKGMSILEQAAAECDVPRDFTESTVCELTDEICTMNGPVAGSADELNQFQLEPMQRKQLDDQMRKHCQLLMQLWVLADETSGLPRLRRQCDAHLTELDTYRTNSPCGANSAFNIHNLDSALTVVGTFGGFPVIPELSKWRTKLRIRRYGDHAARYLRPDQMYWFYHCPGLIYPHLLPVCNLKSAAELQAKSIMSKTTFCQAEDYLIASGLSQLPSGMRSLDKYQKIVQYLLPAKLASQIQKRIFLLRKGGAKENAVQYLAKNGVLPEMEPDISPFNPYTMQCPKDFPAVVLPRWCEQLEARLLLEARRAIKGPRNYRAMRLKAMENDGVAPAPNTDMDLRLRKNRTRRAKERKEVVRPPRDPKNIKRDETTVLELLRRKRCMEGLLGGTKEMMSRVSAACQTVAANNEILVYPVIGDTGPKRKHPDDDKQNDDDPDCSSSTLVGADETADLESPERKNKRRKKSDEKETTPPPVEPAETMSTDAVVPSPATERVSGDRGGQGKGRILPRLNVNLPVLGTTSNRSAKKTRVGKDKQKSSTVVVEVEPTPSTSQTMSIEEIGLTDTIDTNTEQEEIGISDTIAEHGEIGISDTVTEQGVIGLTDTVTEQGVIGITDTVTEQGVIGITDTFTEQGVIGITDTMNEGEIRLTEEETNVPASISESVSDTLIDPALLGSPSACRVKSPLPEPDSPGDGDVTCADHEPRPGDVVSRDDPRPSSSVQPIEFQVVSMAGDDCSVSLDFDQAVRLLQQSEPNTEGRRLSTDEVTSSGERTTPGRDSQSFMSPVSVVTPHRRTVHTSPDSSTSPIYTVTHDNVTNISHSDNDDTGAFSCLQDPSTTPPLSPPPSAEPELVSSTSTQNCKSPRTLNSKKPSPSPWKERQILPKALVFEVHVSPTKRAADRIRNRRKKQIRQSPQRLRPILPRRPNTRSACLENAAREMQEPSVEHAEQEVEECVDEEEEQVEEVQKEEEDDHNHLAQLMAASTTISVAPKKRGNLTKHEKMEKKKQLYDTILRPDILETDPLSEERVMACTIDYLERVRKALETEPDMFEQFSKALADMDNSMDITELYRDVKTILRDHPQLVVDFALFLTPEQAVECGCYSEYEKFQKGKLFMRKLELYFQKMPSQLHRLRKALSADQSHEDIYNAVKNLLRNQPLLLDELSQFIEEETPPESHMTDFEEVYLLDDSGESEKSQPRSQSSDPESCERLLLPEDEDYCGTKKCGCPCHESSKGARKKRKTHCRKCALKVKDNRLYYVGQRRGSQQAVTVVKHDKTTGKPIMPVKQVVERSQTPGRRVRQHSTDSLKLSDAEPGKKRTKKLKRPRSTSKQPSAPECTTPEPPSVSDNDNDSMTEASADDNSDMDTPSKENGRRQGQQVRPGEFESEEEMEISGELEDSATRTDDDSDDHHSDVVRCRGNQSDGASCHGSELPPDDEASRDSAVSGQTACSLTQPTSESDCEVVNDNDLEEACVALATVAMGTQSDTVAGNEDDGTYVSTTPPLPPPDEDEAVRTLLLDVQRSWSIEEDKFILESFRGVDDVSADVFYRIAQQMNCRTAELVESRFNTLMEMMAEMGDSGSDVSESSDVEN